MNRINLICLGVRDIKNSLSFYKKIGFKTYEKDINPPIVFFDNDGTKLELFNIEELAKDINEIDPPKISPKGFGGITLAINMKSKDEVDALMDTVKTSGGTIAKIPKTTSWGGYGGYFQDPDGYFWEVAYGDIWKFDKNNMLIIEDIK